MVKGIEVALQGDGCSHGIVRRVAAQQLLGLKTGTPLVNQYHIHTKTAMQLVGKTPGLQAGVLFLTIERQRQPDNHDIRLPFQQQRLDLVETLLTRYRRENGQRTRMAREGIADGDTDLACTVIESQKGVLRHAPRHQTA